MSPISAGALTIFDMLAAGLWAATWLVHLATLRQIAPDEIAWPHEPSISEEQRLTRAFQFCYAGCYRLLRAVYGARRTTALDDRMDVLAATANWDVTLDRDRARIAPAVQALPLDMQGARYAEVLRYTVATIEQIAGATFARRAIQAAYDALPWPERETASRYCFPDTPWARELSSAFGDVRDGRLRLLRQVDQFLNCDDDELDRAGPRDPGAQRRSPTQCCCAPARRRPAMWVIEAGEIVALRGGQVVEELHRGDSFGAARHRSCSAGRRAERAELPRGDRIEPAVHPRRRAQRRSRSRRRWPTKGTMLRRRCGCWSACRCSRICRATHCAGWRISPSSSSSLPAR